MKECQNCRAANPDDALRCECGYNFPPESMKQTEDMQPQHPATGVIPSSLSEDGTSDMQAPSEPPLLVEAKKGRVKTKAQITTFVRWLCVLPIAIVAMLVTQVVSSFIASDVADSFPLSLIGGRWIAEFLMSVVASIAFVSAGSWLAPSRKTLTAFFLASIMSLCAVWCVYTLLSLPDFSLGMRIVWPRPFGLATQPSPAWWQLLTNAVWAVSALVAAFRVRAEHLLLLGRNDTQVGRKESSGGSRMRTLRQWLIVVAVAFLSGAISAWVSVGWAFSRLGVKMKAGGFILQDGTGHTVASLTQHDSEPLLTFLSPDGRERAVFGIRDKQPTFDMESGNGSSVSMGTADEATGFNLLLLDSHGEGKGVFMSMLTANEYGIYQSGFGSISLGNYRGTGQMSLVIQKSDGTLIGEFPTSSGSREKN